ncbi:restriction endonuclease [Piscinibacter koreensis]|uniref:Restriction endonuclease n=1 Tax=Piscinibacter koreensis TaxID=2742824 RepID=A0A7Y6NP19_9BURK|nr:restriction endonuclease [Schlegelella koreensis]NUZ06736.1 restriction endonuclease [Schlegelella koreensis]
MDSTEWRSYEEVAAHLLTQFAGHFGLGEVQGKQILAGASGTSWEIDAKGVNTIDGTFVVVECKRYPHRKVDQGKLGNLAYCIRDLGATGGIVVTPVGLQKGAEKIAAHERIVTVRLAPESTSTEYMLRFLNQIFVGVEDRLQITDTATAVLRDKDGHIIEVSPHRSGRGTCC